MQSSILPVIPNDPSANIEIGPLFATNHSNYCDSRSSRASGINYQSPPWGATNSCWFEYWALELGVPKTYQIHPIIIHHNTLTRIENALAREYPLYFWQHNSLSTVGKIVCAAWDEIRMPLRVRLHNHFCARFCIYLLTYPRCISRYMLTTRSCTLLTDTTQYLLMSWHSLTSWLLMMRLTSLLSLLYQLLLTAVYK